MIIRHTSAYQHDQPIHFLNSILNTCIECMRIHEQDNENTLNKLRLYRQHGQQNTQVAESSERLIIAIMIM